MEIGAFNSAHELGCGELVAWRWWGLSQTQDGGVQLRSLFPDLSNPELELRSARFASCSIRRHRAPQRDCSCGIYGLRAPNLVERPPPFFSRSRGLIHSRAAVLGTAQLWGIVLEHELGFRAEFAQPRDLRLVCGLCRANEARPSIAVVPCGHVQGRHLTPLCEQHHDLLHRVAPTLSRFANDASQVQEALSAGYLWADRTPVGHSLVHPLDM
jgi:hypothetical protein